MYVHLMIELKHLSCGLLIAGWVHFPQVGPDISLVSALYQPCIRLIQICKPVYLPCLSHPFLVSATPILEMLDKVQAGHTETLPFNERLIAAIIETVLVDACVCHHYCPIS